MKDPLQTSPLCWASKDKLIERLQRNVSITESAMLSKTERVSQVTHGIISLFVDVQEK